MKAEFIKLENATISVQRVHGAPIGHENLIVIDELEKSSIKKGVLVLNISHVKAIELIKQLSQSILDTPF